MQLTRFTDYALRTLIYLTEAPPDEKVSLSHLAELFDMNLNHLNKVSQRLTQLGYISSFRGKQGGIALAVNPADVTIGSVVRDMEPCLDPIDCEGLQCPIRSSCRLRGILARANRAFLRELDEVVLADVGVQISPKTIPSHPA